MGGGNPLKKVEKTVKKAVGDTGSFIKKGAEDIGKGVVDAHEAVLTGGLSNKKIEKEAQRVARRADAATGGVGGGLLEMASGGNIQSLGTKKALKEANAQQAQAKAEQQAILDEQKQALDKEEAERKERMRRDRQGRRSLLYSGTDETGLGG